MVDTNEARPEDVAEVEQRTGQSIEELAAEAERGYDPASITPMTVVEDRHRETARALLGPNRTYASPAGIEDIAQALARSEEIGRNQVRGGIRVLRVVEYVYPTVKAMADDMSRWAVQRDVTYGKTHIRSVALPPEVLG